MSDFDSETTTRPTALVTGGSRGIGAHIVQGLASAGYRVYLTYLRNADEAAQVVRQVAGKGGEAQAFQLDVRNEQDVRATVEEIERQGSAISVLVNNAGISNDGMSWKLDTALWRDTCDVNITGPFVMTKALLPSMRERRYGRIVNIASVVGHRGIPGTAAYAASKAALGGFMRAVAKEVAPRGITVNNLVLGYFDTGMGAQLPDSVRQQTMLSIPAGRFGDPEKLSRIVVFLCSDACDYITGQEIVIDGGFLA